MKRKIVFALLVFSLFAFPMVSAKALETVPDGILNKFDSFLDCFAGIERECHQFDYDRNGVVGLADFGKFIQKYTKMASD